MERHRVRRAARRAWWPCPRHLGRSNRSLRSRVSVDASSAKSLDAQQPIRSPTSLDLLPLGANPTCHVHAEPEHTEAELPPSGDGVWSVQLDARQLAELLRGSARTSRRRDTLRPLVALHSRRFSTLVLARLCTGNLASARHASSRRGCPSGYRQTGDSQKAGACGQARSPRLERLLGPRSGWPSALVDKQSPA